MTDEPVSLSEARALRASDNKLWSALDCARAFVRDLESGAICADAVLIHFYDKHAGGSRTLHRYSANLDREQEIAMLVLAKTKSVREWEA